MNDSLTREQRSRVMARNRGKGTKSTELALKMRLVSSGIRGWQMHRKDIPGKPDFAFQEQRLAIFVDGCFWHGCAEHKTIPMSNHEFWEKKITGTVKRDLRITQELEALGWTVLRYWEHDLKKRPKAVIEEVKAKLSTR